MSLRVNTIYPAFMGEINPYGIGAKCVFLRLAGCNIRCYKKTFGVLCDTPEALEMDSGNMMTEMEILTEVQKYNCNLVCLTGGEPLLQRLTDLFTIFKSAGINVVVETNGTMPIRSYKHFDNVHIILDIKGPSTGEEKRMLASNYDLLEENDFFKFVVHDEKDYQHMKEFYENLSNTKAHRTAGLFWGSELGYIELINKLFEDDLKVDVNMQAHKMAVLYDKNRDKLDDVFIPRNL